MMFVNFEKYFHPTAEDKAEQQRKWRKIVSDSIRQKLCWTCSHTKVIKDWELSNETTITLCEFSGKPIRKESCERWEKRKDLL